MNADRNNVNTLGSTNANIAQIGDVKASNPLASTPSRLLVVAMVVICRAVGRCSVDNAGSGSSGGEQWW